MSSLSNAGKEIIRKIAERNINIYETITVGSELWIPSNVLENLLNQALNGVSLKGLALRTRSKVVKEKICESLGYEIPSRFKRTHPRFSGQDFDTYIQKSNNLQIWNEEISGTRRYVLIRVSDKDIITSVKVVTGDVLEKYDTTGTLTQKYQARISIGNKSTELVTEFDTSNLTFENCLRERTEIYYGSPAAAPTKESLLPIKTIYEKLCGLVGEIFAYEGADQERNRGNILHRLICQKLGYKDFRDDGQFPDIRNQLLEVKLQTSPTIDLGLVRPDSQEFLDIPKLVDRNIRHCDVRYALFCGKTDGKKVELTHFFLTTGEAFFSRFAQFKGKVLNKKLQIPLPSDFFG
jgi:hypothetical protein